MSLVEQLLLQPESLHLDFKREWHSNRAKLVHDILCLSNARLTFPRSRYLVLGVEDVTRTPTTLTGTPNRRQTAAIYDLFKSKLNRTPKLQVVTESYNGAEIDIIIIDDHPDKPYFLLEDFVEQGFTCRAGVVYERVGDSNTPHNGTASDQSIEWMIRERLGLTLEPVERVKRLMAEPGHWKKRTDSQGRDFYFHNMHPEIRIIESLERERDDLHYTWASFPDPSVSRSSFYVNYFGTELYEILVVWCDGSRLALVQPRVWCHIEESNNQYIESFYRLEGSFGALFQTILDSALQQSSYPYINGVISSFGTDEDAEEILATEWSNQSENYTFYRSTREKVFRVRGGEEIRMKTKE